MFVFPFPPTSAACARPRGAGEGSGSVGGRGGGRPPGQSVVRALVPCHGGLQRAATGCEVRGKSWPEKIRGSGALELEGCFPKLCFLPSFQVTNQVSEGPPRPQRASAGRGAGGSPWPAPCRGGTMPPGAFPSSPAIQRLCLRVSFIPPACIAPSALHLLR